MCLALGLAPASTGCPTLSTLPDQAPVVSLTDPATETPYLLYVPSTYTDSVEWPLVVVCHGTWPYDTAEHQMREWAKHGETQGVIVVTPTLAATKGDLPPPPDQQIDLQRRDEAAVLAIVAMLKRQYRIAEDRVFLTGWSAGAYTMLHTGLRHPEIFRAMFIRQGTFDARFMDVPLDAFDPWQGVKVVYGQTDFLRDQSKACVAWLREQGMHVEEQEMTGTHRRIDPALPWKYFRDFARERLWVRIRAEAPDPDDPSQVQFAVDSRPPAVKQKWYFGDGRESYEPSPRHKYDKPGHYDVTVNVELPNGKKYARKRSIWIGGGGSSARQSSGAEALAGLSGDPRRP